MAHIIGAVLLLIVASAGCVGIYYDHKPTPRTTPTEEEPTAWH